MKNYLPILFIFLFSSSVLGQSASFQEVRKAMSLGVNDAFTVAVENLDDKEVEKLVIDYLKEYKGRKNPKKDRRNNEIFTDDAKIPSLSSNTIDIYATVAGQGKGGISTVVFWFDLGGAFLSRTAHPEKMNALSDWMYEFGRQARIRTIELNLEKEENRLKELNKEFDKLIKEQEKLEDTIEKAKKMIADAEAEIKENAKDQENSQTIILEQQKIIENIKKQLKKVN